MSNKKLTNKEVILLIILTISVCMTVFGYLGKGKPSPPVIVAFTSTASLNKETVFKTAKFWNNYPELTLATQNEAMSKSVLVEEGVDPKVFKNSSPLFFRCHWHIGTAYSIKSIQFLDAVKHTQVPVFILYDKEGYNFLKQNGLFPLVKDFSFFLIRDLPLTIETYNLSYFFKLSDTANKTEDVFIPQIESPEIISKYLEYHNINK